MDSSSQRSDDAIFSDFINKTRNISGRDIVRAAFENPDMAEVEKDFTRCPNPRYMPSRVSSVHPCTSPHAVAGMCYAFKL